MDDYEETDPGRKAHEAERFRSRIRTRWRRPPRFQHTDDPEKPERPVADNQNKAGKTAA